MTRDQSVIMYNTQRKFNQAYNLEYLDKWAHAACEKLHQTDGFCTNFNACKRCPIKNAYEKAKFEIANGCREYMRIADEEQAANNSQPEIIVKNNVYIIVSDHGFLCRDSDWEWVTEQAMRKLVREGLRKTFTFDTLEQAMLMASLLPATQNIKWSVTIC